MNIDDYYIFLPILQLEESDKNYFLNLFSKLHPNVDEKNYPTWISENIQRNQLDHSIIFFQKLDSFLKLTKLKLYRLNFQIMWAGYSKQLFIHKDSISSDDSKSQMIVPIRLSWHLTGPKIPLKWYYESDNDKGFFLTNNRYGAIRPLEDFDFYEKNLKCIEITPDYPCLLNTYSWHTICQQNIKKSELRIILSAALSSPNSKYNNYKKIWDDAKNKIQELKC